jgi:membrane protein DedA with SNARE-associated domain
MLPQLWLNIHHSVHELLTNGGYFALFSLLVACGLGLPLPEDIPLFTAGILIARGSMHPVLAPLVGWCGIMAGDTALYCVGAVFGPKVTSLPIIGRHITEKRLASMHVWFERYGLWAVGIGRMFAGIRSAMVVVAGTTRFHYGKFIFADALAAIVSGGVFMWFGYYVGVHHVKDFEKYRWEITGGLVVLGLVLTAILVWRNYCRRCARSKTPPEPAASARS